MTAKALTSEDIQRLFAEFDALPNANDAHPDIFDLEQYANGELAEQEEFRIEAHLEVCQACSYEVLKIYESLHEWDVTLAQRKIAATRLALLGTANTPDSLDDVAFPAETGEVARPLTCTIRQSGQRALAVTVEAFVCWLRPKALKSGILIAIAIIMMGSVTSSEFRGTFYRTMADRVAKLPVLGNAEFPSMKELPSEEEASTSTDESLLQQTQRAGSYSNPNLATNGGLNFEGRIGDPIYAAADGVVIHRAWYFNYGRTVKIAHGGNVETLYAHMSRFAGGLAPGSIVRRGDLIGYIGSTGQAVRPHLFFALILNGEFQDARVIGYTNTGRDRLSFLVGGRFYGAHDIEPANLAGTLVSAFPTADLVDESGASAYSPAGQFAVFFGSGRAELSKDGLRIVGEVARYYRMRGTGRLIAAGYTDRSGSETYNTTLSLRRAAAVRDALIRQGIPSKDIAVVGHGESGWSKASVDGIRDPKMRSVQITIR
jgi:hypothetical protein